MTDSHCSQCGMILAHQVVDGLCPRCMLASGLIEPEDAALDREGGAGTEGGSDFELLEELGAGGMGMVHKALQLSLGRVVALKLIQDHRLHSPAAVERFRWEAETAARLQHPNIVAIYGVSRHQGTPCFAMEYIEGRSLAAVCAEGPVAPRQAAGWVRTLAETMDYAHQHGVLHRDLKPSNVLIDAQGRPHVADFGLAKRLEDNSVLTLAGEVLGSPSYMAPEQAAGGREPVTTAIDIYSLGGILYELLTGQPPFVGHHPAETLRQVLHSSPTAPRLMRPSIPRDLETICLKCLEKEPGRRYASARDVAEELDRQLRDEPILARPTGPIEKAWRWARRNRRLALLTATSLVLLVAVAVVSTVAALRLSQSERQTTRQLYDALLSQARAGHRSGQPGRRFDSLEVLRQAAALIPRLSLGDAEVLDLRNEAIACLALTDLRPAGAWTRLDHSRNQFIWPDDSLTYYSKSATHGWLTTRRLADDVEVERFDVGGVPRKWERSTVAGDWLAVKYEDNSFRLWEVAHREVRLELKTRSSEALAFSRDGRRVAVDQADRSVLVLDLNSSRRQVLPASEADPNWLAFSESGRLLAVSSTRAPTVRVWNIEEDTVHDLPHPAYTLQVAWHPGDRFLAVACADHRIHLWDVATWKERAALRGHQAVAHRLAWHPGGRLLVSWGWDGVTRLWDPFQETPLLTVPGPEILRFGRDGTHLAYRNGLDVGLWEVAGGEESRIVHLSWPNAGADHFTFASFSHDGRLLAAVAPRGVGVWDAASFQPLAFLSVARAECATFHPRTGDLVIGGAEGAQVWPVTRRGEEVEIGPAQRRTLTPGHAARRAVFNQSGSRLAIEFKDPARGRAAAVFEDASSEPLRQLRRPAFHEVTISPDGRWAAAGNWHNSDVIVWKVDTGVEVARLSAAGSALAAFSPDQAWLVTTTGEEYQFWEAGTWRRAHRVARRDGGDFPGVMSFTADGRMMALAHSRYRVKLVETTSGRELAALETPHFEEAGWLALHPEGDLLAVASGAGGLRVWDLRRVRDELRGMELDWSGESEVRSTAVPTDP